MITIILLSLPVLFFLCRIVLILNSSLWVKTTCNIIDLNFVKKRHTAFYGDGIDDSPTNYINIKYEYEVDGKKYTSNRISLDLVDRGYRPVEIEHDIFINELKSKKCSIYFCKYFHNLSVINNNKENVWNNVTLLFIYILVIISSYFIVIFMG